MKLAVHLRDGIVRIAETANHRGPFKLIYYEECLEQEDATKSG